MNYSSSPYLADVDTSESSKPAITLLGGDICGSHSIMENGTIHEYKRIEFDC